MTVQYKGYIIAAETEPWAIKYGLLYVVYWAGNQGPDDCSKGFCTIEEAQEHIDEVVDFEKERLGY